MRESSTHTSIKLCARITIQNGSLSTSCLNTNLTTISHVAQCTLFRMFNKKIALKCRGIPSLLKD